MAISSVGSQGGNPGGNNGFKNNSNAVKLDVVGTGGQNGEGVNKQNALSKIAQFRPTQLKNFSANVNNTIAKNKQASKVNDATANRIKQKVQSIKSENPFANKNPVEAQVGSKINLST